MQAAFLTVCIADESPQFLFGDLSRAFGFFFSSKIERAWVHRFHLTTEAWPDQIATIAGIEAVCF